MFSIDKYGKIIITVGDTATIKLHIQTADGKEYKLKDSDEVVFTAKKNINQVEPSIQITAQSGVIIFPPNWKADSGLYVYDIQLTNELENVYTVAHGYMSVVGEVTVGE